MVKDNWYLNKLLSLMMNQFLWISKEKLLLKIKMANFKWFKLINLDKNLL